MLPEISGLVKIIVAALLFAVGWAASVGLVYWDTSRRGLPLIKIHAWTAAAALAPFFGFGFYILVRLLGLLFSQVRGLFKHQRAQTTLLKQPARRLVSLPTLAASDLSIKTLLHPPVHAKNQPKKTAQWEIAVCSGPGTGKVFRIENLPLIIGRGSQAGISLVEDLGVSREHARIYEMDGFLFIRDLNSTHGTLLNGEQIEDERLTSGDRLQIGLTELQIERVVG
jgi:hypothetical protein